MMMLLEKVLIRKVKNNEIAQLREICTNTFFNTYASENTEEDMQQYLSENFSIEALTLQLNNPDSLFYFAEFEKERIGYIKLNKKKAQTESVLENALEIERIYVTPSFQGNKVGHLFMKFAIKTARSLQLERVWLGVWDRNTKAIEFYKKNGFTQFAQHDFILGKDKQTDAMMKFELNDHS